MKLNKFLKALVMLVASVVMMSLYAVNVSARGTANINVPSGAVDKESKISIPVKFTADDSIGFVTAMLSYDDDVLDFQPSDYLSGGGGVLTINAFPDSSSKELTVNVNFKAKKTGKCKIELSNCYITSDEGTQIGSPTAYGNVTVSGNTASVVENESSEIEISSEEEKIGDPNKGYLTSLTVSKGTLKPAFAYDIYDYTVDVDYDVDFLEIEGKTANASDQIWYTGNEDLIVGKNVRTVKVTDAQGYNHIYTVTINRSENPNPSQSENEVIGSEVINQAEDDSSSKVSEAPVIVDSDNGSAFDKNKDIITTGLIIVLATLIIAIVVIIVWLKRKKK